MVFVRRPAARATLTNCTPSGRPVTICSNENTGIAAQSERIKPRLEEVRINALLLLLKHSSEFDFLFLPGSGALREGLFTSFDIALLAQQLAKRVVRTGVVGIEFDCCAQGGFRAVEIALLLERGAEH